MTRGIISSQILLVEDSEEDFITVQRAFDKAGLKNNLIRVDDGDKAIRFFSSDQPLPGMILLDLNLPGIDGYEVLKFVKGHPKLKKIPVIILTTSGDERDVKAAYDSGANSYMKKPVEFGGFVEAISRLKDFWFEISILPKADF